MQISRIEWGASIRGIERMQAYFRGHSFSPHRHDTYAVGLTLAGVQTFDYRGATRRSLSGHVFVLHPDERHDGRSGDARGFGYRIAYIDPALIREAAATRTLPFVREPVSRDPRLRRAVAGIVASGADATDELAATCGLAALAEALASIAGEAHSAAGAVDLPAVQRARDLLLARLDARVSLAELEAVAGLSRWQLARQFRQAFGVSPHRFHVLRRLDRARALLGRGYALADVALATNFADQAHLTRQFKSAYGLPPGRWRVLAAAP